jgi:hypothetical protein
MKIKYYSDPGHGWAVVPVALLDRLDLVDQVSTYSYIRGRSAYLEEDCDLSRFMAAAQAAGLTVDLHGSTSRYRRSKIRGYDYYSPARARQALATGAAA